MRIASKAKGLCPPLFEAWDPRWGQGSPNPYFLEFLPTAGTPGNRGLGTPVPSGGPTLRRGGGRAPWPCLAVLALLSTCASPDPRLYTLVATPAAAPVAASGIVVELRRVAIPGYLDRPEIVRSAADYRVHLATNDRWSEPFGDLLQRVLADDLTLRLPGATVFTAAGALSQPATEVVAVDIDRLDADGAGAVVLDAQYEVHAPDAPAVARQVHLTAPTTPDVAGYAAALSAVTGALADAIARDLPAPPGS